MTADVTYTPVRSTWTALTEAQSELNKRLASLLAAGEAKTGIDVPHNAVSVVLSSSSANVNSRAQELEATPSAVNIAVSVAPRAQVHREPQAECTSPFSKLRPYCEPTLVAGVALWTPLSTLGAICTVGPMLIEGNESYMLTAAHCLGGATAAGGEIFNRLIVKSEYPARIETREIGQEGKRYITRDREIAEIKIKRTAPASAFLAALPTPLPALVTEWFNSPRTPHAVEGSETPIVNQSVCHQGRTSGEQCGRITRLEVTDEIERVVVEHLVETNACGEGGDSGGPYFFTSLTRQVLMEGVHIAGTPTCPRSRTTSTSFEPLVDVGGNRFGILLTFAPQQLLTRGNERRAAGGGRSTSALLLSGEGFPVAVESLPKEPNEIRSEIQNAAGQVTGTGFFLKGELKSATEGEYEALYLKVTLKVSETKCNTAGDREGEVLDPKGKIKLVHDAGSEAGNGILLEVAEFTIECGAVKIKIHGNLVGLLKPGNEMVTKGEAELGCSSTLGVPAEKSYWLSLLASELTAKLEANFGTGFREACEELNPGKTVELDFSKMVELMQ
jgi:hypothetical protein